MSILIKGLEMPHNCGECWALDERGDYPFCNITQEQRGYDFDIRKNKMDKCPLVEVPTPHGRLIDADKLKAQTCEECIANYDECIRKACDFESVYYIFKAPTVIEAEGSGDIE